MNITVEPTIDDIRRMANEKRPKIVKPPPPKRVSRKKLKEPIMQPEPEPEPLEYDDEDSESEDEIIIPPQKKTAGKSKDDIEIIKQLLKNSKKTNKNKDFDILYESISDIKNLINQQKTVIEEAVKPKIEEPKSKPKPKPKPRAKKEVKPKGKSLDLTVSDKEVEQLISSNKTQPPPQAVDTKLQEFLNAFKRH